MTTVSRHLARNAGNPSIRPLPAKTRDRTGGEATPRLGLVLAYSKDMGGNTFHYRPERAAGLYWRRRFIVLVIGLAVFAAAAWGLSTALRVPAGITGPAGTRSGNTGNRAGGGAASKTSPATSPSSAPRSSAGKRGKTTASKNHKSGSGSAAATGKGTATTSALLPSPAATGPFQIKPAFCARASIVLSVFVPQSTFGAGQAPDFSLNVVSTQPRSCSFNVGSGHMVLVVKEGSATIWNSADCASGTANLITVLKRGVPTVLSIAWDRKTAAPGCPGHRQPVPAGSYTVRAVDGTLASDPVTFRLS